MRQKLTRKWPVAMLLLALIFSMNLNLFGQKREKVILYENFGGTNAGSSDISIQPDEWPAIHADSGKLAGWYTTSQNIDNKGDNVLIPQFYSNSYFSTDDLKANRTGGIDDLDITVNDVTKEWSRTVSLRNGYINPLTGLPSVGIRFLGAAVLPKFSSWISYAPYTPNYLKNQTDEIGYLYLGKDLTINTKAYHPMVTIPDVIYEYLKDISKIEMLLSGSRLGQNNTVSVKIEELDEEGVTLGTKTYTYSATIEPRLITVPVERNFCRIYIQGWGSANNSNVTDFALLNGNTEVDTRLPYNYNAIPGTKPDGTASTGQNSNPGIQIHMLKIYAYMDGGYTITTNNALVTGTTSNINHGQSVILTAQATNGGNKFMGWKISGKADLSEVVNPLTVTVTKDMTIMPVYAGDLVEVPVVNETFTNWTNKGTVLPASNNMLKYDNASTTTITTNGGYDSDTPVPIKVALQYGYKSHTNADSISLKLKYCYVIPNYGLRVYNMPGWQQQVGYAAIVAKANNNKGFILLDTLDNVTKAEVSVSSYDIPSPDRACAFKLNGAFVRSKMLQSLYAQTVTIDNSSTSNPFVLQIGPGTQARCEYVTAPSVAADLETGMNAAAVAIHSVKIYSKINIPAKNYYQLIIPAFTGGYITGQTPEATNSTNHYTEGTKVTIGANPTLGFGFDGWYDGNGTLISLNNPVTITMDADKTLKPVFAKNPSYIKLAPNANGTISTSIKQQASSNDTLTFLAGVPVSITATPKYGFKFTKWVKNGVDATTNPLVLAGTDLVKNATIVLSVVYDSILTRQTLTVNSDLTQGVVTFNYAPENPVNGATVQTGQFPTGVTIDAKGEPAYGYDFVSWRSGLAIAAADTMKNPATIVMSADKTIQPTWKASTRKLLIIRSGFNGSIAVSDIHKTGTQEQAGLWPTNYNVELTATPASGFVLASIGDSASGIFVTESVITVNMDRDTVIVRPEFVKQDTSVSLCIDEKFQDATRWPENPGTVSNVPGAIDFLGLSADWDPRTYSNLESLLKVLAPYRVWGSQSNDNSDGPNGTKTPKTTLNLVYKNQPLVSTPKIGVTNKYVRLTVTNYAPCNNCIIGKAVKEGSISNYYLGHVTPGMLALKRLNVTNRKTADYAPFMANDTVGMMQIEGLAYIEKVKIGYVSGGTQYCPGVFYTVDPIALIGGNNLWAPLFADLYSIGQLGQKEAAYTPYNTKYGWGSSQEGMIMDQNMYIAETGYPETKLLITSGYKSTGDLYTYSDIYIHDLKVWGIPNGSISPVNVRELIDSPTEGCKFFVLGNTQMLKVDTKEIMKAVVIFNMKGQAIKVFQNNCGNLLDVSKLRPGVYGVQAIGRSGKLYKGSFGKAE
jgi:hypothetical protein